MNENVLFITPWEREALQLLADGATANELRRLGGLSGSVIDARLQQLFASLGAATPTEAIAAARKRGLLRPDPVKHSSAAKSNHRRREGEGHERRPARRLLITAPSVGPRARNP